MWGRTQILAIVQLKSEVINADQPVCKPFSHSHSQPDLKLPLCQSKRIAVCTATAALAPLKLNHRIIVLPIPNLHSAIFPWTHMHNIHPHPSFSPPFNISPPSVSRISPLCPNTFANPNTGAEINNRIPKPLKRKYQRRANIESKRRILRESESVNPIDRCRYPSDEDGNCKKKRHFCVRPFDLIHTRTSGLLEARRRLHLCRRCRDGDAILIFLALRFLVTNISLR
jgi:hypothetical protein